MNDSITAANEALNRLIKQRKETYYPLLHIAPPAGWMNDPNGLIYFNGQYHVFYQHYPYDENWGPMHWGHAISHDLVNWQHLPIALAPDQDYDKDGCFSGCAVDDNGLLTLIYTGHVWLDKPGNDDAVKEVQCLATSNDGINFIKHGPIVEAPQGISHFRDPKVWKQDNEWFMVVGARSPNDIGLVLLYRSLDLRHWQYEGVLAESQPGFSYMWECPDLFPLGDKYILMFSPQGVKPQGYNYRNLFQSGYLVGQWSPGKPFTIEQPFQEIDAGHDFYAPQSFKAADGRRIIFAWMNMWQSVMPSKADKWAGSLTLPRQLTLNEDNKILQYPINELTSLRGSPTTFNTQLVENNRIPLNLAAEHHEILVTFDLANSDAERFGLELAASSDGTSATLLYIDNQSGRLVLDRSHSGLNLKGYRSVELPKGDQIILRIIIDKSSIEIFVNQGQYTLTSRIYPNSSERSINLFAENGVARLIELIHWPLSSIFPDKK